MPAMQPATVATVQTSAHCISYRLVASGRVVWSNRVYNRPEGHAGGRRRMLTWARAHGYRVIERSPKGAAMG